MTSSLFLFLRRLRRPLLVLIFSYAVGTLGLVLIPGMDAEGRPVRLDFLHAFYIASYTGTTIGFGEIPHPFTPAQRLWMLITIYVTVIAWVYSIGAIITTLQEPALRRVIAQRRFETAVRHLKEPFYLVCGYGDSGEMIVRELRRYGYAVVVLDIAQERLDELSLQDLGIPIPAFCYDVSQPEHLVAAGLTSPHCIGVLGFTGSDEVNLGVAMAGRLLNPRIPAICRCYSTETAANMASFGTRHIVNPFEVISERLGLTFRAPSAHAIHECLTSSYRTPTAEPLRLPQGRWVVCGYGRFGQAAVEQLLAAGNTVRVIELDPRRAPPLPHTVIGRGTEAAALQQAGVEDAVGIIAGTDSSINNLSIIVTARELNPRIFTVARQVASADKLLFKQAGLDLRVRLTYLASTEAVELLRNPLLPHFLDHLNKTTEVWAAALLARMARLIGDELPFTWTLGLNPAAAPAVCKSLAAGTPITLGLLMRDPQAFEEHLPALGLLVCREGRTIVLPDEGFLLRQGDELLFCGRHEASQRMWWACHNIDVLSYLVTGVERPDGWIWRWWAQRQAQAQQPERP